VTWSPAGIDAGVRASLIQIYPIILSALLAISRHRLSQSGAHYALTITSPPLIVYLTISSICDMFGIKTSVYKRIRSRRRTIRALGALILPLWLALSFALWLSKWQVGCEEVSVPGAFSRWLSHVILHTIGAVIFPFGWYPGTPITTSIFLLLFRRRSQVMADFRACWGREPKPWGSWRIPWTFVKCAWYVCHYGLPVDQI